MGGTTSTDDIVWDMHWQAALLEKQAARHKKQEGKDRKKLRAAMQKGASGNDELSRIHAENSVRHQNMATDAVRSSARMSAMADRMSTLAATQRLADAMQKSTRVVRQTLADANAPTLTRCLTEFEKLVRDVDAKDDEMERTAGATAPGNPRADAVDALLTEVADELGLVAGQQLPAVVFDEKSVESTQATNDSGVDSNDGRNDDERDDGSDDGDDDDADLLDRLNRLKEQ